MTEKANLLYDWSYEDSKDRSPLWYMVALSIAIWLIIWGFLTKQYGMSIVIMLIIGFFFYIENNSEDNMHVEISTLGIKIHHLFYDYSRINSYSIMYSGDQAVYLRLHLNKKGVNFANVRVDNRIAGEIRPILSGYIEENPKGEIWFMEKVAHLLKL